MVPELLPVQINGRGKPEYGDRVRKDIIYNVKDRLFIDYAWISFGARKFIDVADQYSSECIKAYLFLCGECKKDNLGGGYVPKEERN
jgi:hypothetical protein